jgi:hypothetical protein
MKDKSKINKYWTLLLRHKKTPDNAGVFKA